MEFIPSYDNYRKILKDVKACGKFMDFYEAQTAEQFLVLRHDIEFSPARAYAMSLVETAEGVCSTYFVQITNNAYNAMSYKNMAIFQKMAAAGHHIGLHYHMGGELDPVKVRDGIRDQIRILSEVLSMKIDRFSIHRPVRDVGYNEIPIEGIINAYSSEFFTLADAVTPETELEVKYIADSQHRWNYGCPDEETIRRYPKIQLLIHPDFWNESGYDSLHNFEKLIADNTEEYMETLDSECKHFSKIKDQLCFKSCKLE